MTSGISPSSPSSTQAVMLEAASTALRIYASGNDAVASLPPVDAGPAVLAALVATASREPEPVCCVEALGVWLDRLPDHDTYAGLFGGIAGFYAGAQSATWFYPRLAPLAGQIRDVLTNVAIARPWKTEAVAWEDYDLVSGPAGALLALDTNAGCPPRARVDAARHLASLCDRDDLERFRVAAYQHDSLRGWNYGRINTGLAHGVTGVAAALRSASDADNELREELRQPLRRVCHWLVANSFVDERGLRTWPPAGLDGAAPPLGASRRQAWCYGTPGVAWTLWDAGRVLGDTALQSFAEEAIRSYCAVFDERFYLDESPVSGALGICHGAAGICAIADAFARYAHLPETVTLRNRLERYLLDRLTQIESLARENMSLLTGASGMLTVLLTTNGGERAWLSQIALR